MIGFIDSGIGGLSALSKIEELLPKQTFLYFCDLKNFPYGNKSQAEICRSLSNGVAFLLSKGATIIIIACHSASVSIDTEWKKNFPIPILTMVEPTIETASAGKTGLIGTEATFKSGVYQKLIPNLTCVKCPSLAEKIQNQSPELQKTLRNYLSPFIGKNFNEVIIGCTHYSFIYHEIEEELDSQTRLLDPSDILAKMSKKLFPEAIMSPKTGKHLLFIPRYPNSSHYFKDTLRLEDRFEIRLM